MKKIILGFILLFIAFISFIVVKQSIDAAEQRPRPEGLEAVPLAPVPTPQPRPVPQPIGKIIHRGTWTDYCNVGSTADSQIVKKSVILYEPKEIVSKGYASVRNYVDAASAFRSVDTNVNVESVIRVKGHSDMPELDGGPVGPGTPSYDDTWNTTPEYGYNGNSKVSKRYQAVVYKTRLLGGAPYVKNLNHSVSAYAFDSELKSNPFDSGSGSDPTSGIIEFDPWGYGYLYGVSSIGFQAGQVLINLKHSSPNCSHPPGNCPP